MKPKRTPKITVIKAASPEMLKECTPRERYLVLCVNIASGHIVHSEQGSLKDAQYFFSDRGDPPMWRGLQILRVET